MKFIITARCAHGHIQELRLEGLSPEWAQQQCGLLDGTSDLYLHSPLGTDSLIGKCGICGAPIQCSVREDIPGPLTRP